MLSKIINKIKLKKKTKIISAIEATRYIIEIINTAKNNKEDELITFKNITSYLINNKFKSYSASEFNYFNTEFDLFFFKIKDYLIFDETCVLWILILKNITNGRDDTFIAKLTENDQDVYDFIYNHFNFKLFIFYTPSKNIFYDYICNKIKEISFTPANIYYIDIIIYLQSKNFFNDETIQNVYLKKDNPEKTVKEFYEKLNIYKKAKKIYFF